MKEDHTKTTEVETDEQDAKIVEEVGHHPIDQNHELTLVQTPPDQLGETTNGVASPNDVQQVVEEVVV